MDGRTLRVVSTPLESGPPRFTAFRFRAPRGAQPEGRLGASDTTAAVVVVMETRRMVIGLAQAFAGPVGGPWPALGPVRRVRGREFFPGHVEVDGPRAFVWEARSDLSETRYVVHEAGQEPLEVSRSRRAVGGVFAGDLVAFGVPEPRRTGDGEAARLVVQEWRTGTERASMLIPGGVVGLDLRPDGRAVIGEDGGGLVEMAPGGTALRQLSRDGKDPVYAGDRVVFFREGRREGDERLAVVEPSGEVRPFGVPTARMEGYDADDRRVLWAAHGCLLVADLSEPAAAAPGPGICPRTELVMEDEAVPRVGRDRRVRLVLRCVAAPEPGCRGTVRLRLDDVRGSPAAAPPKRFRIPAGRRRRIVVRLTRRGYRALRREAKGEFGGAFQVRAVTVDPAGRRSVLKDLLGVEMGR